jgi:hypothetical protein
MSKERALGLACGALLVLVGGVLLFYDAASIIISWETVSEVNTQGFNLFRAVASAEGPFVQVNEELIPARGDPLTGSSYQFRDQDVEAGRAYVYQIEEVEWGGARSRYPEVVEVRAGVPRWLSIAQGLVLIALGCGLIFWQACSLRRRRTAQVPPRNQIQNGDAGQAPV